MTDRMIPLEKAAREIWRRDMVFLGAVPEATDDLNGEWREHYLECTRAVLTSLLDPPEEVVAPIILALQLCPEEAVVSDVARAAFNAAIRNMLEEG